MRVRNPDLIAVAAVLCLSVGGSAAWAASDGMTGEGEESGTLEAIAACESGGDPTAVSADGTYRGKYGSARLGRATLGTGAWASVGGSGDPAAAPEAEQDYRAVLLYSRSGSSPWPNCG